MTQPMRPGQLAQAVEITTATYDQIASDYAARHEMQPPYWIERTEQFVDLLTEAEELRPVPELGRPGDDATLDEYVQLVPLLDAGCGTGRDARALAAYGYPVLAVDLSQGMLDQAQERTARRLPRGSIRYTVMDLRHLELPDTSCRGVWCSASLLHVPLRSVGRAMGELARVTRAGGPVALILKARLGDEAEVFVPYEHLELPDAPRLYVYYTPAEARALVESAGLEVLDVGTHDDTARTLPTRWISILARNS